VELEFHQIDVRYERLRVRQPARERRLLASLADAGQQIPIVVVATGAAYVVVDGHKRVRCLQRLQRDTVAAVIWEMPEPEALIFWQLLHTDATASALEQGWLLRTLHEEHGLALDALARRFDRSVSWVSRRLSLVLTDPLLVLRVADDGARATVRPDASAPEALFTDLHILGAVARRAHHRLQTGAACCPRSATAPGDSSTRCRRTFAICSDAARRSYAMLDQGLRTAILGCR
jgi:ParB family chromosome partitioning protein